MPIYQSVEGILHVAETSVGRAQLSLPDELRSELAKMTGFNTQYRFCIPVSSLRALLDQVRTIVVDWTIDLERKNVQGVGMRFSQSEVKAAQAVTTQYAFNGAVGAFTQGSGNTTSVSQQNGPAARDIAAVMSALVQSVRKAGADDPVILGAAQVISTGVNDINAKRDPPWSRLKAAFELIKTSEDIALKAPEAMSHLHNLAVMLGWT